MLLEFVTLFNKITDLTEKIISSGSLSLCNNAHLGIKLTHVIQS